MKYHPVGKRGVALQVAHDRYRPGAVADKFTAANKRTTFFCQIETAEGVENADKMAAIDGVDCLWVGHFDLSVSLGIPGQFDHHDFKKAIDKTIAATKKHKKALGRLVPDVEQGIDYLQAGLRLHLLFRRCLGAAHALAEAIDELSEKLQGEVRGVDDGRQVPRRAVGRFQEGGWVADLSRFRPRAAQDRARGRDGVPRIRQARFARDSWRISTR